MSHETSGLNTRNERDVLPPRKRMKRRKKWQKCKIRILKGVLQRLRNNVGFRESDQEICVNGFVHYHNVPHYICLLISEFVAEKRVLSVHIRLTSDLEPSDFWLLPKVKTVLKGKRFDTIPNIQRGMAEHLEVLPKNSSRNASLAKDSTPLFSTVLPSNSCSFCPVGLSLLIQHFQQVLWVLKLLLSPGLSS